LKSFSLFFRVESPSRSDFSDMCGLKVTSWPALFGEARQ